MERRVNRRKYRIRAMDIESHNDPVSISKKETSIWLGCDIDENSKVNDENSYFYTIEEYLKRVQERVSPKCIKGTKKYPCKNELVYIYNLSFEWSFILPVLLKLGFIFKSEIDWKNDEYVYNTISTSSVSSVWCVNIKFKKNSGRFLMRDLSKIYAGGVREVAKKFGLETQKGEIDYRKDRRNNYVIPFFEKEYCFKDTKIIMEMLEKIDDRTFWNSNSIATYTMKKALKFSYPRTKRPYLAFREMYPELDEIENNFVRKSVEGGLCYPNPQHQFKTFNQKILHIDMHQAHPTSLALNEMPYGKGEFFQGEPPKKYGCSCCHVKISYTSVKLYVDIKLIGLAYAQDYEMYVWDFMIPTMKKCYVDLEIKYIDGYYYKKKTSPFRKYMMMNWEQRARAKQNKNAYDYLRYKLLNNSFYGKLLEKGHNVIFENTIDEEGIITSIHHEKETKELNGRYAYVPMGSCIPARSRQRLIETALLFGADKVLYCDTDSLFILWDEETKKVLETKINLKNELGGWGIEDIPDKGQFTASKRYKIEIGNKLVVKAGGINFQSYMFDRNKELYGEDTDKYEKLENVPFDEINIVSSKYKVNRAFRCKGGTLIDFQEKEIKVQEKHVDIYKKNILK